MYRYYVTFNQFEHIYAHCAICPAAKLKYKLCHRFFTHICTLHSYMLWTSVNSLLLMLYIHSSRYSYHYIVLLGVVVYFVCLVCVCVLSAMWCLCRRCRVLFSPVWSSYKSFMFSFIFRNYLKMCGWGGCSKSIKEEKIIIIFQIQKLYKI